MVFALPIITKETTPRKVENSTITLSELPAAEKIEQFCRESMILQQLSSNSSSAELDNQATLLSESEDAQDTAPLSSTAQKTGQCFKNSSIGARSYPDVHPLKNYEKALGKQTKSPTTPFSSVYEKKMVIEKEIIHSEKKTESPKESKFRHASECLQKPLFTSIQRIVYISLSSTFTVKKDTQPITSSSKKECEVDTLNRGSFPSVKQENQPSLSYHQKWYQERREGGKGHSDQQQQQEKDPSQKEKQKKQTILKVEKKSGSSLSANENSFKKENEVLNEREYSSASSSLKKYSFSQKETKSAGFPQKYEGVPLLTPPEIGIYALCWIISKLGITTSNRSQYYLQQEIRELDKDINISQSERIKKMTRDASLKKSTTPWSIMTKVMSWIGSFMAIITGIALIATGAGVVAGAMLITSGALSMTNHLLEATGGWTKIAQKLGKENPTKTRSMIMWMQLSIAIVSFILGGAAVVVGGFNTVKEVLGQAGTLFVAVASTGIGVLLIAKGIMDKKMHDNQSTMKSIDRTLAQYENDRENNLENSQDILFAIERFYEQLLEILRLTWADARRVVLMR
jgi:hypothetical protein